MRECRMPLKVSVRFSQKMPQPTLPAIFKGHLPPGSAISCVIQIWCFKSTQVTLKPNGDNIIFLILLVAGKITVFIPQTPNSHARPQIPAWAPLQVILTVLTLKVSLLLQITFRSAPLVGISTLVPQHGTVAGNHRTDTP